MGAAAVVQAKSNKEVRSKCECRGECFSTEEVIRQKNKKCSGDKVCCGLTSSGKSKKSRKLSNAKRNKEKKQKIKTLKNNNKLKKKKLNKKFKNDKETKK